jgi:hypothetical protein
MNINRNNYETFFLLYVDNELSAVERKAVEDFISQNEDLKVEMSNLLQAGFRSDEKWEFTGRDALLRPITEEAEIDTINREAFFVLYADDELNNEGKAKVEAFVYRNPQYQQEFELLQQVKLQPDRFIVFENKASLYRKEEKDDKVVPFRWRRMAAAAVVLLIAGLLWLMADKKDKIPVAIKNTASVDSKENLVKTNNQTTDTALPVVNKMPKELEVVTGNNIHPYNKQAQAKINTPGLKNKNANSYEKNEKQNIEALKREDVLVKNEREDKLSDKAAIVTKIIGNEPTAVDVKAIVKTTTRIEAPIIDQPAVIINPDERTVNGISYASGNDTDNLNVLNSTVNKKNTLRGLFRKASRIIAKRTNPDNENGRRRSILIGSFEIAAN